MKWVLESTCFSPGPTTYYLVYLRKAVKLCALLIWLDFLAGLTGSGENRCALLPLEREAAHYLLLYKVDFVDALYGIKEISLSSLFLYLEEVLDFIQLLSVLI